MFIKSPSAFSTVSADNDAQASYADEPLQAISHKSHRHIAELRYRLCDAIEHERQITMHDDGKTIKGRDQFMIRDAATLPALTVRFHLHPDIRCQQQKEQGIMLTSLQGSQWLFSCNLPKYVTIEESVYLGYYGKPQKTLQLCIALPHNELRQGVSWELRKQ